MQDGQRAWVPASRGGKLLAPGFGLPSPGNYDPLESDPVDGKCFSLALCNTAFQIMKSLKNAKEGSLFLRKFSYWIYHAHETVNIA